MKEATDHANDPENECATPPDTAALEELASMDHEKALELIGRDPELVETYNGISRAWRTASTSKEKRLCLRAAEGLGDAVRDASGPWPATGNAALLEASLLAAAREMGPRLDPYDVISRVEELLDTRVSLSARLLLHIVGSEAALEVGLLEAAYEHAQEARKLARHVGNARPHNEWALEFYEMSSARLPRRPWLKRGR